MTQFEEKLIKILEEIHDDLTEIFLAIDSLGFNEESSSGDGGIVIIEKAIKSLSNN